MKCYMFPGQGSQKKGMGEALFRKYRRYLNRADEVLGYSLESICLDDPHGQLSDTLYTQPALYVVNCLSYLKLVDEGAGRPDFLAGHSLGEYCALFVAGAFSFEDGLSLVKRRAELMSEAPAGGMAAVIGCDVSMLKKILNDYGLNSLDIANRNAKYQTVISGPQDTLSQFSDLIDQFDFTYIPLNVSSAFHSRYMQEIIPQFMRSLSRLEFNELCIPVISNIHASPYKTAEIAETLALQVSNPVDWLGSVEYMLAKGTTEFVEVGPGNVLKNLKEKIV